MQLLLSLIQQPPRERQDRSDIFFGAGVAIVLLLLAAFSIASGVAPLVDPATLS